MITKSAGELIIDDVWRDGAHRYRVVAIASGPAPSIVRITSEHVASGKIMTEDFYRTNRVEIDGDVS